MNRVKLKDVAIILMGQSPEAQFVSDDSKIGLPLLNGPAEFTSKFPIPVQFTSDSKRIAEKNDILFCVRGSTTGRMNIADQTYAIGRGLASIKHKNGDYLNSYIKAVIETNLKKLLGGTLGSVFPNLTKDNLFDLEFYCHDLPTQQKIAAVLSALDDKIEVNNKINAELEAMAKTLYDYWFVQFDFPNTEGKPYKSSGGKMVFKETLKREIPDGWEVKNLFESAKVQYGFPFSTDYFNEDGNGIPVIRIRDILNNSISNFSNQENIDEKYLIEEGDVLIGMDGNFHVNYWTRHNCYLNQRVVMIKETELPNILLRYQVEPYIQLREKSVSRTTVGHLSDKDLKAINILVPTERILNLIKPLFDSNLKKIIVNSKQNQELSQLRDWLLPMLMNGQVRVEDAADAVLGMVAEPIEQYTVSSDGVERTTDWYDQRFELWLAQEELAARGEVDRKTLRILFDAMDDHDK